MHTIRVSAALAVLAVSSSAGAVSLEAAGQMPGVQLRIESAYSYQSVRITVANHTGTAIVVADSPGTVLVNEVASEQDLTLAGPLSLRVPAGGTRGVVMETFCVEAHDAPPHGGVHFHARGYDKVVAHVITGARNRQSLREEGWQRRTQAQVWNALDRRAPGASPVAHPRED